jgi:signal transduction histidine kinase/DNA-binding NarL/FixJ family response regulator
MLWLFSGLAIVFGCFYSGWFLWTGLWLAAPVGAVCVLASVAALRYARASGRHERAFDLLGGLLFAMLAGATLLQDGIHSPALWWLAVPAIGALIAGRVSLGASLAVLFVAHAALLYRLGPGSIGPISLLAADPALQMAMSMSLSAVFVAVCAALGSHWGSELRGALERAREAALEATAAKARFVTQLSHEIRTPLQGMIGATEMLREPDLPADRRATLCDVQRQSASVLMDLVNDVLDAAKLDAGKVVLERRPLNLAALVRDVEAFFAPDACARGIELASTASPDVPELILGDATRIRQVVANLVANAIKFTPAGGVHIHLGLDGEAPGGQARGGGMRVRIQVADSGVGIDPARLPLLFEPFQQADESIPRRFGGTGLGLSIANELAELMGGRIEATSAVGRGSTFTLVMPLAVAEAPAPSRVADGRTRVHGSLAGTTVVVAEDDAANQAVVVAMLELLHVRPIVAATGHEALAALATHRVDAVLMDVHLPGLDGLSATRAWRKRGGSVAALPFVAMTGSTGPEDIAACREAGMDVVLGKPFALAQLQRVLLEATRPAAGAVPPGAEAQTSSGAAQAPQKREPGGASTPH